MKDEATAGTNSTDFRNRKSVCNPQRSKVGIGHTSLCFMLFFLALAPKKMSLNRERISQPMVSRPVPKDWPFSIYSVSFFLGVLRYSRVHTSSISSPIHKDTGRCGRFLYLLRDPCYVLRELAPHPLGKSYRQSACSFLRAISGTTGSLHF